MELIPQPLRDRLDAARDHLHVEIRLIPRGHADCRGRDFDVHQVRIGPLGWERTPVSAEAPSIYEQAAMHATANDGPATVEARDLERALAAALDHADARWPE